MKLILTLQDESEISFDCIHVTFGVDGRDLYAVTKNKWFDKFLIARLTNNHWYATDPKTLAYNASPVVKFVIIPGSEGSSRIGDTQFELGWQRGYDQGYNVGMIQTAEMYINAGAINLAKESTGE